MKRYMTLGMAIVLLICLCACNSGGETSSAVPGNPSTSTGATTTGTNDSTTTTTTAKISDAALTTSGQSTTNSTITTSQTVTAQKSTTVKTTAYSGLTTDRYTTTTDHITTGTTGVIQYHYYNPLKPEKRFFGNHFSIPEIGKIVDMVRNLDYWFCITEDGSLYELSEKLFSTTDNHYRKIESDCLFERFVQTAISTHILTKDGQCFVISFSYQTKKSNLSPCSHTETFLEFLKKDGNRIVQHTDDGGDKVVYTFPKGEIIEYISTNNSGYENIKNEYYRYIVKTNEDWYILTQHNEVEESGYADKEDTITVVTEVSKMTMEASTIFYFEGERDGGVPFSVLITTDGTIYY